MVKKVDQKNILNNYFSLLTNENRIIKMEHKFEVTLTKLSLLSIEFDDIGDLSSILDLYLTIKRRTPANA